MLKKALLLAHLLEDGRLLIQSLIPDSDDRAGDVQLHLQPGEHFGGRTFDEWLAVACGPRYVSADWLEV